MLSVMENVPGWEQQLRAYNEGGGHSSYLSNQQWVGENTLDGIGLSGDTDQVLQSVNTNLINPIAQIVLAKEKAKLERKNGATQQQKKQGEHKKSDNLFEGENLQWLLVAGAVIIGGVFLISVLGGKKGHAEKKGE